MVDIIEPAAINLQLEENMPCKLLIPTGKVYIESFVSIILGQRNSPQEPINVNTASTAKVGFTIGITTFTNIFNMIDAECYTFRDGCNFFVQANFNPQYKERAVELVKSEILKLQNGITERELNKAKKKLKSRFACEVETVSDIGETIGYYMTVCDDLAIAEDYLPICEEITCKDLEEAAKKYLDLDHAVISLLVPQKEENK
mgnify:CR=1 FL=1